MFIGVLERWPSVIHGIPMINYEQFSIERRRPPIRGAVKGMLIPNPPQMNEILMNSALVKSRLCN
jgi:hypothetical protein